MGKQSQAGHVIFATQDAQGDIRDDISTAGIAMRIKSGGLGGNRELMIPDPEIGGNRDISDALLGPVAFVGEYDFYARLNSLATLLYWGLGSKSSSHVGTDPTPVTGDLVGTHAIAPIDGAGLPWGSIEEKIGDGLDAFQYRDARVNTLHLEADAKGYLQGTVGLIALAQHAIGASFTPDPDFDESELIVGSNITFSFGGNDLHAKSFKMDLNNNMEDDDFRLGSLFLGDAVAKRRECTFGATIRPEDRDMWRQAMYGDSSLDEAGGVVTKSNVVLTCESYAFIGDTATVFSLEITVPSAALKPIDQKPSGDDIIQYDLEIQCLRPDPNVDLLAVEVVNGLAEVV